MQQYQNVLQDKFGNVIVGASVAVYVYGTTTPATIYSGNGTGLLPSNTVTTSSLGEFAFYAANGRYSLSITATNFALENYSDFILYDPADIGAVAASGVAFTPFSTIAATNVQNAIQEVVSDLSGASGSSLVGFLQSGTGAVARTAQAKLHDTVSVKDFGAVGDGSTDDTAAIQACIDAAPTGSTIYFPIGKYVVSASLTTGNKTLIVQGSGYRASVGSAFGNSQYTDKSLFSGTVIFSSVTSGVAFDCNPLSSWAINLRDIAIVGPGSGTSIGIRQKSQTAGNTLIGNVWWNVGVFNFSKGYEFSAVLNSVFTRLRAVGCTVGFEVLPYSSIGPNNNTFIDLETYFTGTYAFYAIDCAGLRLIGPLIQNMSAGGKGIYLTESTVNNTNDHVILNAWLEHGSGTYDSIYINGGRNIHVLDAHGAGSARIVVAAGTKHRITGARLTGTGNVIEIASGVTYATVEQLDLESGGTVLDNGTYTQIDMLYQTETAANIASTTASINTTNKFTGKVVWDSTNNRVMRSSGAGTSDPWVALDGHVSITPNTLGGSGNVLWKSGSGTPESAVTAPIGSLYTRTNGGAGTTLYIKESGTGNTGWVAK